MTLCEEIKEVNDIELQEEIKEVKDIELQGRKTVPTATNTKGEKKKKKK